MKSKSKIHSSVVRKAFIASLPIMSGYIVLGIGFGLLLKTHGYGFFWSLSMSTFIFAGSMQYVCIDLLSTGASILTTALTTLMVNARHLFYGISMVDKYKKMGKCKPYLIFALTDETYSLVCNDYEESPEDYKTFYFCVSIFDQLYWITGSLLGTLLGAVIPFSVEGIDFSLTALFITVVVDQWKASKNHFAAIAGAVCSILCLLIFGPSSFLIPTMILITITLFAFRKFLEKKDDITEEKGAENE